MKGEDQENRKGDPERSKVTRRKPQETLPKIKKQASRKCARRRRVVRESRGSKVEGVAYGAKVRGRKMGILVKVVAEAVGIPVHDVELHWTHEVIHTAANGGARYF